MANWKQIKTVPEAFADMLNVTRSDDRIDAIELTHDGDTLRITCNDYGGIKLYVPAPPRTVTRWQVTGTIGEAEIKPRMFDNACDAEIACSELRCHADRHDLKWEAVEVPDPDGGAF